MYEDAVLQRQETQMAMALTMQQRMQMATVFRTQERQTLPSRTQMVMALVIMPMGIMIETMYLMVTMRFL